MHLWIAIVLRAVIVKVPVCRRAGSAGRRIEDKYHGEHDIPNQHGRHLRDQADPTDVSGH